jgi:hypothetical protein
VWLSANKTYLTAAKFLVIALLCTDNASKWHDNAESISTINDTYALSSTRFVGSSISPKQDGERRGTDMDMPVPAAKLHSERCYSPRLDCKSLRSQFGSPMLTMWSNMIVGYTSQIKSDSIWYNHVPNPSVVMSNTSSSIERSPSLSEQRQLLSGDEPSWKMISGGGTHCEILNGCVQDLKGGAYGGTSWECSFEINGPTTIKREEWGMEYEPSCSYDFLEVTSQTEGTSRYCGGTDSDKSFPRVLSVSSGTTSFAFRSNGMGGSGGVGF